MVKSPAFVCSIPIPRAIGPPRIKLTLGNILARDINPVARRLCLGQLRHFYRCMADHFQQFFVAPDIVFARRNVQIPDQNRFFRRRGQKPIAHISQVI